MRVALLLLVGCSSSTAPRTLAFEKHTLDNLFRAEGIAIFDVDHDGHADLVTDMVWYAGPDFVPHEIRAAESYDPMTQYSHGFAIYPEDLDGDGYKDIIVSQFPGDEMVWYRNPQGADVHWDKFVITPMGVAAIETPIVVELFAGAPAVVLMSDASTSTLGWFAPGADPTQPWILHAISAPGNPGAGPFSHGIGAGDLDGDGRKDVLTGYGWFQQTADPATWIQRDFSFGPNHCSQIQAFDADGDGRADVFCSTPHDYGFSWWRQDAASFTQASIDDTISQMHDLELADLDHDGIPELVSGKRWMSHPTDPGANDPALLVAYQVKRTAGATDFVRLELDDDSGIGTQFAVGDIDGDGWPDIAVSNKKGTFWFRSR